MQSRVTDNYSLYTPVHSSWLTFLSVRVRLQTRVDISIFMPALARQSLNKDIQTLLLKSDGSLRKRAPKQSDKVMNIYVH